MARIVKPRWDYEPTHNMADFNLRIAKLETDIVMSFFGELRPDAPYFADTQITICFDHFYGDVFDPPSISIAERKAAHEIIRQQVRDLQKSLAHIDRWSQGSIEGAYFRLLEARGETVTEETRCLTTEDSRLQAELGLLAEALDAIGL